MLAENSQDHLTDEEADFAKVIHSSGEDLLALINDILDISKVEAGKLDISFDEMNMSEVPVQIEQTFAPVATKKNLQFLKDSAVFSRLKGRLRHVLVQFRQPNDRFRIAWGAPISPG